MRLLSFRNLPGPNVYSDKPMLMARIDLEDLAEAASNTLPGFVERLLRLLPALYEHRCSKGYRGGFVERLHTGTYLAHIIEHIALELSGPAGIEVGFGKTVAHIPPRIYDIFVRYKSEPGMRYLLESAAQLADSAIHDTPFDVAAVIAEAKQIVSDTALGPSTEAIADACKRANIPCKRLNEGSLLRLGYGKNRRLVQAAMTSQTSAIAMELASDKEGTKQLLRRSEIPVPDGEVVRTREGAISAAKEIGSPVVIKPLDGNQGKGVSLGLVGDEQVGQAFDLAARYSSRVIVEEMLQGRDYRVLLVNGKIVAASERLPANVLGDGQHTVAELVEIENRNPLRGDGHEKPLTKLRLRDAAKLTLERAGKTTSYIPAPGERVFLCGTANLSTGGTAADVTDAVHPANITIFERAARVSDLDICGLDVIMPDVALPMRVAGGGIIEVNASPGLRMHLHPTSGEPRDVGSAIVEMLYPNPRQSRIPIISTTGTNGKTTVTRLIAHCLQTKCCTVGMTTTDGIWVGGEQIGYGDSTGPNSTDMVLSDPSVEVAVLECARGGLVRRGLGYDWSDVGILTNIQEDHLGQDGIETVEDILRIKSLVAERVREGGTLILNADDALLARLPEQRRIRELDREIVFVSTQEHNLAVGKHVAAGGRALFVRDGFIIDRFDQHWNPICRVTDIPMTVGGTAEFQVYNVMFALAACSALGLEYGPVVEALTQFSSAQNPGRANLFHVGTSYVLADYGHNSAALSAISRMTSQWHSVCVTGVITFPGDRTTELIAKGGKMAAHGFDKIIIREDLDPRGREPGEIARILENAIREENPHMPISVVLDERESFERALRELREGEVAVLFYDNWSVVSEVLEAHQARPVASPDLLMQKFAGIETRAA
jgi:cyanophycin synthetase